MVQNANSTFNPNKMSNVLNTKINENFSNIIKENNAVIAGGFLLNVYLDLNQENPDLDLYVNYRNLRNILIFLFDNGYQISSKMIVAMPYDQSFFYKNGILGRVVLQKLDNPDIDLIIVNDDKRLVDLVTNFDLSFCEIWYDGDNIMCNDDVSNIINKVGILKPEYARTYLRFQNPFIRKRLEKYTTRGFTISIPNLPDDLYTIEKPKKHLIDNQEELWAKSLVISKMLSEFYGNEIDKIMDCLDCLRRPYNFGEMYDRLSEDHESINDVIVGIIDTDFGHGQHFHNIFMELLRKYDLEFN